MSNEMFQVSFSLVHVRLQTLVEVLNSLCHWLPGKFGPYHTYIRFNEKISQDTQDQRPLTCDLNTKEIEKQLNYGNTTNCERSMLFNRLLKLSEDGASTTYSGNIFQISQTRLQKKYLWAFTLDWCLYSLYL